jgi:hypothetical protein
MALCLIDSGQSPYRVIIPRNADEAVRAAAGHLIRYLAAISGVALPLADDSVWALDHEIVVSAADRPGVPSGEGLKNDGYRLKTQGKRLFILGENSRACLYGVFGFLEKYLGCRFFSSQVEKVPLRSRIVIPCLDETVISPFEYRETLWYEPSHDPDFAIKRGFNSSIGNIFEARHGSGIRYLGFVHTFKLYIPDAEFFESHPEYFAMVNGKRICGEYAQLCLTNPDVYRIMLERALDALAKHPECTIISLSQNDGFNPCTCPECARIDAEEGGYAGTLIRFVNALAREIGKVYPHVLVDTLAYRQTRQPPRLTRPEPNVLVRMCTIECCFSHPIARCTDESAAEKVDGKPTATFQQDLDGWREMCDRMFIWDYTTNFLHYLAPFPNLDVLQPNIQYFLAHHVTGLFEQGNGESPSGEFGELRAYLISKLMWEPDGNVKKWRDEFLCGYYGMAAAPIGAYIDLLHRHVRKENVHLGIYSAPEDYLPDTLLNRAEVLWDEAERLAEDAEVLERVRRSRLQLTYVKLRRMPMEHPGRAAKMAAFEQDVAALGITRLQEHWPAENTLAKLSRGDLTRL